MSLVIAILVMTSHFCRGEEKPAIAKGWDRDFLEDEPDLMQRPFFLAILSCIDDRLIGYFVFRNSSVGPVLLHGIRTGDDEFWPMVRIEVADAPDGKWTGIPSNAEEKASTSMIVEPNSRVQLKTKMDSFLPFLSKFKCGRVVLENGEIAVFDLKDLLPPKTEKTERGSP